MRCVNYFYVITTAVLLAFAPGKAVADSVVVGDHTLSAGGLHTISLYVTPGSPPALVQGLDFFLEVTDLSGAGISSIINSVDLSTNTIFTSNSPAFVSPDDAAVWIAEEDTNSTGGPLPTDTNGGLLATLTLDTTGLAPGSEYLLKLGDINTIDDSSDPIVLDTQLTDVNGQPVVSIENGTITIAGATAVPLPSTAIAVMAMIAILLCIRVYRVARRSPRPSR